MLPWLAVRIQHFLMKIGEPTWEGYLNTYSDGYIVPTPLQDKTWFVKCNINPENKNDKDVVEIKVSRYKPRGGKQ